VTVPVRVLVVEDHPIFRDGLLGALATEDIEVVGVAGTVEAALAAIEGNDAEPVDLALVDLSLPDGSGVEVVRAATSQGTRVLVLTMSHDPAHLLEAVRAGARGYVVKGAGRQDIVSAIASVMAGDAVFGAEVADLALQAVPRQDTRTVAFPQLTAREHDILDLLALGLPNAAIAARLHLSDKTVRNHVSAILAKLGVDSRHGAAELARARFR
jgi:DNA-binding NarL/FixJ family response regulator